MVTVPTKVGISVSCGTCGRSKLPHGRSAPMYSYGCDRDECSGYHEDPKPGCLWPGETDADFGYDSCDHSTRKMTDREIADWIESKEEDE